VTVPPAAAPPADRQDDLKSTCISGVGVGRRLVDPHPPGARGAPGPSLSRSRGRGESVAAAVTFPLPLAGEGGAQRAALGG
jgi:hypothetical protein